MNAEKLKKLQAEVRIGGKGSARRKKKVVHQTAATDDKKLQSSLKKLSVNTIPGIEEVNMIKDDGTVIHFNNPKAQASLSANTFAITGHGENKQITEMLPGILQQLGAESLNRLKKLANNVVSSNFLSNVKEESDVPNLVENFDEISENEDAIRKREVNKNTQRNAKFDDISKLIPVDSLNLRPTNEVRPDQNINVMNESSIIPNLIKTNESEDIIDIPVISVGAKEKTNIQKSNDTKLFDQQNLTANLPSDKPTTVTNTTTVQSGQISPINSTNTTSPLTNIMEPIILPAETSIMETTTMPVLETAIVPPCNDSIVNPSTNSAAFNTISTIPLNSSAPPLTDTLQSTVKSETTQPATTNIQNKPNIELLNTIQPSNAMNNPDKSNQIAKLEEELKVQQELTNPVPVSPTDIATAVVPDNYININQKQQKVKTDNKTVLTDASEGNKSIDTNVTNVVLTEGIQIAENKNQNIRNITKKNADEKVNKNKQKQEQQSSIVSTADKKVNKNKPKQEQQSSIVSTADENVNKKKPNQEQQTSIVSTADENVNNKPNQEQQTSIVSTVAENVNKNKPNQEQQTSIVSTVDENVNNKPNQEQQTSIVSTVNKNKPNQEQEPSIVDIKEVPLVSTAAENANKNEPNQEQQTNIVDIKKQVQLVSTADENMKKPNQKQVDIKKEVQSTQEVILPILKSNEKVETDEKSINTSNLVTNANEKLPCESTEVKKLVDNIKPTDKKDKVKNDKNQKCTITEDISGGASAKDKKTPLKKESPAKKNVDKKKPEPKKKNDKDKKSTTVDAAAAAVAGKKDVNKSSSETAASANTENSTIDK